MKQMKFFGMLVGLLFLLVACGGSKEASDSNLKQITFVLDWTPNTNHTGLYVAKELGYLKEEGIDMQIVQPSDDSSAAVVGMGRAELGVYFQPNMVKRLLKGTPITAVAAICQHNTGGIMSLQEEGIVSPKDLTGKKFSTWEDPIDDATIAYLVNKDGGDWSKVQLVPGESTDATTALKMKLFDSIFVYYGWDYVHSKIMDKNNPKDDLACNFFYLTDFDETFDYYTPVIIANNDFLVKNPELAKKALKAIKKGYEYAVAHPDEAAEILIKNAPETDPEFIRASQKYLSTQYIADAKSWGEIDSYRWNNFYHWLYEQKLIDQSLENKGFTNEYLN